MKLLHSSRSLATCLLCSSFTNAFNMPGTPIPIIGGRTYHYPLHMRWSWGEFSKSRSKFFKSSSLTTPILQAQESDDDDGGGGVDFHRKKSREEYALLRYMEGATDDSILFKDAVSGKLSFDELYDLVVRKNRPKKKPISMHSLLASFSAVVGMVILLPTFAPCIDEFGLPQIFDYNRLATHELLWQCQFCAILQMISSIMGVFRLPKNSPLVRVLGFVLAAFIIVQIDLIILSNLNGTDVYLFNAFSTVGRIIVSTMNTVLLRGALDNLSLVIGDAEQKGWDTVPGYENRLSAIITTSPFLILTCILGNASLPILGNEESFRSYAEPFFAMYPGVQTLGYLAINLSVGLGALLATLQFEKKISGSLSSFLNMFLSIFLMYDGIKFMYLLNRFPDRFPHSEYFMDYTPQLQTIFHTNETLFACVLLAILKGFQNWTKATKIISQKEERNMSISGSDGGDGRDEMGVLEGNAKELIDRSVDSFETTGIQNMKEMTKQK